MINKATLKIKDLHLRTIIGFKPWEREKKQDVIINIKAIFDMGNSMETDDYHNILDYKVLTKKIIQEVEENSFYLIEKLAKNIVNIMAKSTKILEASVEIDKPGALRFTDSVSITLDYKKDE